MGRHFKRVVRQISERTNLRTATVKDLLEKGWTYREGMMQPLTWTQPRPSELEPYFIDRVPSGLSPKEPDVSTTGS